ncbi:hypothetical protein IRJ41_019120 [Triplophysa rosa]|uniref:Uncharacterized protein n=1 Tax=Triplophysa rosa TaxID=992332 RepID=A0A9W7T941_TRIRA|nr:hypothetical protein IRJ41_019120 [Triplophysa rosa]
MCGEEKNNNSGERWIPSYTEMLHDHVMVFIEFDLCCRSNFIWGWTSISERKFPKRHIPFFYFLLLVVSGEG